ncbi:carbon monoxide dehydrogenase [Rhodobacteraceae bacterium WD3A24]|nr:carbon monoxide dehydrogenase [Rhodobacteraceae bacterium WD3A24]
MQLTSYARARTMAEALALFETADEPAYLAGGHTLIPVMKNHLAAPDRLIDLRAIPELGGIARRADSLRIGAAVSHAKIAASPPVRAAIPALAALAGSIGDVQVRNMGTIGGSLAHNDPAADYPAAVLALGARVATDRRTLAAEDFFEGLFGTALEDGEIIRHVELPVPAAAGYAKFRNPASRYALVAAFVARAPDGAARVAITGAGSDGVFRWAEAEAALGAAFAAPALDGLTPSDAQMLDDIHAAADERAALCASMTARAVMRPGRASIF